jgi:hypothetical protein
MVIKVSDLLYCIILFLFFYFCYSIFRMNKMYTLSSVVLVLALTGICTAQQREALSEWTATDYPNPMKDPALCGRYDKSFICDPNGILTLKEGR